MVGIDKINYLPSADNYVNIRNDIKQLTDAENGNLPGPVTGSQNTEKSFSDTLCKFYSIAPESSLNENDPGSYVLIGTVNGHIGNNENVGTNVNVVANGKIIDHTAKTLSNLLDNTKPQVNVASSDIYPESPTNLSIA